MSSADSGPISSRSTRLVQIVTARVVAVDIGSRNCSLEQGEVDVREREAYFKKNHAVALCPEKALVLKASRYYRKASVAGGMWHHRSQNLQDNSAHSEKNVCMEGVVYRPSAQSGLTVLPSQRILRETRNTTVGTSLRPIVRRCRDLFHNSWRYLSKSPLPYARK